MLTLLFARGLQRLDRRSTTMTRLATTTRRRTDAAADVVPRMLHAVGPVARDAGRAARVEHGQKKRPLESAALDEVGDQLGKALLVVGRHAAMGAESPSVDKLVETQARPVHYFDRLVLIEQLDG